MLELLRSSSLRMPLLVAVMMHLSQQLSGINCVSDVTMHCALAVNLLLPTA